MEMGVARWEHLPVLLITAHRRLTARKCSTSALPRVGYFDLKLGIKLANLPNYLKNRAWLYNVFSAFLCILGCTSSNFSWFLWKFAIMWSGSWHLCSLSRRGAGVVTPANGVQRSAMMIDLLHHAQSHRRPGNHFMACWQRPSHMDPARNYSPLFDERARPCNYSPRSYLCVWIKVHIIFLSFRAHVLRVSSFHLSWRSCICRCWFFQGRIIQTGEGG